MKKKKLMIKLASAILAVFCTVNLNASGKNRVETVTAETQQATVVITGTVNDNSGETLPGVSVIVKGTNIGTATDIEGRYSISVPNSKSVLVFSYIGYTTQSIVVGEQTKIDVSLSEDAQLLNEVVVVGYGTAKKADLAGNVATLNANDIRTVPASSLSQALAGRLPGVAIRSGNGGKPGNNADVVIGARSTWNNTSPLYVIDGIVRDADAFNQLSSSDIEHFSVLKDASAAAVYGARAANGVFIVTTKRGQTGKPTITYSGSYTIGEPAFEARKETFEERYYATNAARMEMNAVLGAGKQITKDGYQPAFTSIYNNGTDATGGYVSGVFTDEAYAYYSAHQYDRLKEVYHTPATTAHSVNVSGGGDNVKYYIGGNFMDESAMFEAAGYKKYNVRSNIEASITKNLKASLSINLSNDLNRNALQEDGGVANDRMTEIYHNLRRASALAPGIVDGQYIVNDISNTAGNVVSYSALANGAAGIYENERNSMEYTAGLTWDIPWVKGLTAKAMYNRFTREAYMHSTPKKYEVYSLLRGNDATTQYAKDGGKDPSGIILVPELGAHSSRGNMKVWQGNEGYKSYQANAQLSYINTFDVHAIDATLVYERTEGESRWFYGKKTGLKVPSLPYLSLGGDDRTAWESEGGASEEGRISYVGRFGYTFDSRYQVSFSFRNDLSAKFGPFISNKSGFFPAGNIYWRASEESFLKNNTEWLDNLKLRASLGLTGNDGVDPFQYLSLANINADGMYWGGDAIPGRGVVITKVGNPNITWEKSLNYNAGIDLGIFKMFNLSADLWKKHTYDILGSLRSEMPDTFGGGSSSSSIVADVNYGIVDSWGLDIELRFNKAINKNVTVWAKGNFGWADNKLINFAESGVAEHLSKIGKNYDRWAMFKSDGIVWDLRPQLDESGNQITKDYNDGKGPQKMYVVKTSKGNTYVVPQNYYITDNARCIDNGNYNNMRPGTIFPVDLNGDGHFDNTDPDDKTWGITHYNPPYNFGLLLGGSWKGLSLEMLIQGSAGNQNYLKYDNMAGRAWDSTNWGFWSGDVYSVAYNPTGTMPILVNGPADANNETDFWVRDASFVRLKNITLAYELPKSFLSKLRIAGANVYVSAQNLCFLYNKFKFFDPEMTSYVNPSDKNQHDPSNYPGLDIQGSNGSGRIYNSGVMNYPLMRTVSFGLSLSF